MGPTFRDRLFAWFSPLEQRVLFIIATRDVSSVSELREALESFDANDVAAAFERVQETGIVDFEGTHFRVRIPLFRHWIARYVDSDPNEPSRIRQRRLAIASLGATTSAVLFGIYAYFAGTQSIASPWLGGGACKYQIVHPARVEISRPFKIKVARKGCAADTGQLSVRGSGATLLAEGDPTVVDLKGTGHYAAGMIGLTIDKGPWGNFEVALAVGGAEVGLLSLPRDYLGEVGEKGRSVLKFAIALPLLIGLLLTLNRKTFLALDRAWRTVADRGRK
jgi:hypothetical protein